MRVNYKQHHSINYGIYGYAKLYFMFTHFLSYMQVKGAKTTVAKSFVKHTINSPTC